MFHITKPDNAQRRYRIEWARGLEQLWRDSTAYGPDEYIRPRVANGFEYQVHNPGQSGASEPIWTPTIGAEILDGSIVWKCVEYGENASDSIVQMTVIALDAGITIGAAAFIGTQSVFEVSGGEIDHVYDIEITIETAAGETHAETLRVTVT